MSYPNPWDDREFFQRCKIGGRPVLANLVAIDGNEIEDEWNEQRSTGQSGARNIFRGTKPAGPAKLTFEIAGDTLEDLRAQWDDLRIHWENLAPKAGSGTNGQGATIGSPGSAAYGKGYVLLTTNNDPKVSTSPEDLLKQAQAQLAAVQSGANTAASTPGAPASVNVAALAPGPKPPTLSLTNGYFNYVGITSISRKKWKGPYPTATNAMRVDLELVLQKDPVPAAVGASAPKSPDASGQKTIAFGDILVDPASSAKAANTAAAGHGAYT